jgi:hypothetical protein
VQSAGYVRIIRTGRMPESYFRTRQIRFVPVERAIADAARSMTNLGDARAAVAEAIQNGGCNLTLLITELNEGPVTGSRFYRMALRETSFGSRSAAEGDFMTLIGRSDLPEPMYNAELYTAEGIFLGMADAWWQRAGVVGEVDSRQYHLSPRDYERTVMRHNRMAAHGINLLHFLPSTLKSEPSTVVANLRGAIKSGLAQPPLPIVAKPSTPASTPSNERP